MHAWPTQSRARRGWARCRECNASSSAPLSGERPQPTREAHSRPRPPPPARRSRALSRPSPRRHRASWWACPLDLAWPWASRSGRQDSRARRTCSRERSRPMPSSAAGQGRALRGARRLLAVSALAPAVRPMSNRRCHASAVRRRPPRRWPEFLHETLPPRREIARLARRLEPQGIEAISVRGHRLCLRRHGRQQLVSIQCPRTPRSPTTQRQMHQKRGVRGERRVRR